MAHLAPALRARAIFDALEALLEIVEQPAHRGDVAARQVRGALGLAVGAITPSGSRTISSVRKPFSPVVGAAVASGFFVVASVIEWGLPCYREGFPATLAALFHVDEIAGFGRVVAQIDLERLPDAARLHRRHRAVGGADKVRFHRGHLWQDGNHMSAASSRGRRAAARAKADAAAEQPKDVFEVLSARLKLPRSIIAEECTERAAIREHLGGMTRIDAERAAISDVQAMFAPRAGLPNASGER
jgi:hypothetical protein